jgi:hypothetical protein
VKWIFLFSLILAAPGLAFILRSSPRYIVPACFLFGASYFIIGPKLWAAPVAWPLWPGLARGIEVSYIDAISVALIASTKSIKIPSRLKLAFGIYCLAILISTIAAYQAIPAIFYWWQLFRTVLLFVAIARVCATVEGAPIALISGLGVGMIIEAFFVAFQYATGNPRPGGHLGHPNFIGLSLDFVVFPAIAILIGSRRTLLPGAVAAAGLAIAVLGGSRATMGLIGIGAILTVLFSIYHRTSPRKNMFAGLLALIILAAAPAMLWAANRRSEAVLASSDYERSAMKEAARMMIADHPLGVGPNQYVLIANTGGYSQRAGVAWNEGNRAAAVHSTYYLVTAEMSFLGLLGFVSILLTLILLGFKTLRSRLPDQTDELAPGLLATMIVVTAHISYEFVFMDFILQYLFAIAAGMLVALAVRARAVAPARARRQVEAGPLPVTN